MKYIGSALLGFLLGLAYCYWKAIVAVYQKKDVISTGLDALSGGQAFYNELKKL